jgi:hypothetical protein
VWRQLPQLQELCLDDEGDNVEGRNLRLQSIFAGIAAATSMTNLHLHSWSLERLSGGSLADIGICPGLAGLSSFEKLCTRLPLVICDRALTALTGLTHLEMACCLMLDGTKTATVVARSLTRLRHLDLSDCCLNFGSTDLMLALGQLTQLTLLDITRVARDGNQLAEGALMQLTGLRHLKDLRIPDSPEVSEEVLRVFWAAVRGAAGSVLERNSLDRSSVHDLVETRAQNLHVP